MHDGREASVWEAFAEAFGDGLVFGVGMYFTRRAVRRAAERTRRNGQHTNSVARLPQHPARDPSAARTIDLTSQFERQLSQLENKLQSQFECLHQRDRVQAEELNQQLAVFREHMISLHREFAQALSRLVDDQIATGVAARVGPLEEQLRQTVRDEVQLLTTAMERRLAERDSKVFDLILSLGQTCVATAGRMSPASSESSE
jgi:hypothetical protein